MVKSIIRINRMKLFPFLLVFLSFNQLNFLLAQSDSLTMKTTEMELCALQDSIYSNIGENNSFSEDFEKRLYPLLRLTESFIYPFDSLKKKIRVLYSPDSLFKIYGWEQMPGGNWHDYKSVVQYRNKKDEMLLYEISDEREAELGKFSDVIIYSVHQPQKDIYLLIGFGTHGSGMHHKFAQLFQLKGDSLKVVSGSIDKRDYYYVESPRVHKINLVYSEKDKTLSHEELEEPNEENAGWPKPTGKNVVFTFSKGQFIKKE